MMCAHPRARNAVRVSALSVALAGVAAGLGSRLAAQQPAPGRSGELEVLHAQEDIYVVAGAGANITIEAGSQGVVVVDTGNGSMSEEVVAAIRRLSPKPIRYVLDTNADRDHVGGNERIVLAGEAIPGRNFAGEGAELIAHENVLNRLSDAHVPIAAIPTSSYFVPQKDLYFNGQAIQIFFEPNAHANGDSMIFFRKSDVLSVGDLFSTETYPVIDVQQGGSVNGFIKALNHILELQVAGEKEEGGTLVVPGHGRICDEADVVEYRDMVTIIRDRVQDLINRGKTLEQVKAANMTLDFDGVYGATTGSWTTDVFVDAVYSDLSKHKLVAKPPKRDAKEPKRTSRRTID